MNLDDAQPYAEELEMLSFYPSNANARVGIQKIIAEICHTPKEARRLVDEMTRRYSEWPGPATLHVVYNDLFNPPAPRDDTWHGLGEPPQIACERCRDLGWVCESRRHIRCHCEAATYIEDHELAALDRIYRRPEAPAVRIGAEKPTAEEMAEVLRRAIAGRRVQ